MKLTDSQLTQVKALLWRAYIDGYLQSDGPTSLFARLEPNGKRMQFAVCTQGDKITVRTGRWPFSRPLVFTVRELMEVQG